MAGAGGATVVQPQPAAGAAARSGGVGVGAAGSAGAPVVADPRAEALRCPRCDSANTKFCYYNNYSLSQPRHFCKACKRYWTRGGTLRNVPVGGGCRKNKRSRSSSGGGRNNGASSVSASASASAVTSSSALSLPPPPPGSSLPSLMTSALGLPAGGASSLASLLLGTAAGSAAGGDHLGLFQAAMQSVVSSEATAAYEMQQQQTQVDHLLGLGYGAGGGGGGAQIHLKPWMQDAAAGAGGIMDCFYAPLLSSSLVPGLEELHVKAEVAGAGDHQQQRQAPGGDQHSAASWELPSSSNVDANIIASDALMAAAAAASMNNPAVSSTSTAPTTVPSSFMYWGNGGGIGGAAAAWPDLANCGSSIATLF